MYTRYSTDEARAVRNILIELCEITPKTFYRWLDAPDQIKKIYRPIWMAAFRTNYVSGREKR